MRSTHRYWSRRRSADWTASMSVIRVAMRTIGWICTDEHDLDRRTESALESVRSLLQRQVTQPERTSTATQSPERAIRFESRATLPRTTSASAVQMKGLGSRCAGPNSRACLSQTHEQQCDCLDGHTAPSSRRTVAPPRSGKPLRNDWWTLASGPIVRSLHFRRVWADWWSGRLSANSSRAPVLACASGVRGKARVSLLSSSVIA